MMYFAPRPTLYMAAKNMNKTEFWESFVTNWSIAEKVNNDNFHCNS